LLALALEISVMQNQEDDYGRNPATHIYLSQFEAHFPAGIDVDKPSSSVSIRTWFPA
jgi:hypothetical protein